jgi:hypothetical protein
MKCPYCEYKHGYCWIDGTYEDIKGDEGKFYQLSNGIVATREEAFCDPSTEKIHACPSCGKIFIEV